MLRAKTDEKDERERMSEWDGFLLEGRGILQGKDMKEFYGAKMSDAAQG